MKRYLSLDILRGLTVALMIMVNNPGSWDCKYPPLSHASWDGCTPCDLVFPFFLFCVGVSMVFALAKFPGLTKDAVKKIFKRGILLYLVGLGLSAYPFFPLRTDPELSFWQNWIHWAGHVRVLGVLPRIAICYVLASILVLSLKNTKRLIGVIVLFCLLHVGLLLLFAGPEGAFTLEGNFARKLDMMILGDHIYHGYGLPFEPEGLLGVLTSTSTVLLGYVIGEQVKKNVPVEASARIFSISAGLLLGGLALSLFVPINKPLWSASYVLYAAGWASFVFALCIYLIDVRGWEKPFFPFKALGMNALILFVLSGLLMRTIELLTGWDHSLIFGKNEFISLCYSVVYMIVHLIIAVILYKKKIFIKL